MIKNFRIKRIIIIAIILAFSIIVGGIVYIMGGHYVSIRGQRLESYRYSSGGGMTGGYHHETVKRYDEAHALISIEKAEWHNQDPEIEEYLADVSVMDELEGIIRRYRMNFWNGKKFTNEFIADGESEGYSFSFDSDGISFSSQLYPARYDIKLRKLHEIIDNYLEKAEKLPGLVNDKIDTEENYYLPEGKLELYVYTYSGDYLGIRVLNGTEKPVEIPVSYKLINTYTDKVIAENDEKYTNTVDSKSRDEIGFSLNERLEAGNYKLVLGGTEIPFEIR